MKSLKPFGYLLFFLVPALLPFSAWLARHSAHPDAAAWFPLFFLFVLLPLADYAVGTDSSNPRDAAEIESLEGRVWYRALTLAVLPIQLALVWWAAAQWTQLPLDWTGRAGWLLSAGFVGGVVAINVAHELIHKRERLEQWAGGVLLCTVGYFGFKIEHVRGHHVHVSTPEDASSAPLGATVYPFIVRSFASNTASAWRLEAQRLKALGLPTLHWRNEMLWWSAVWLAMGAAIALTLGATALAFFVAQGLIAALTLEIINYVEHYGLERKRLPNGRYERTTHLHSWNSNYLVSNLMLFQLQRHSDHHENARRRYQALVHHDASPQLPGGYAAMLLLALVPPLWKRVIDPRVLAFRLR